MLNPKLKKKMCIYCIYIYSLWQWARQKTMLQSKLIYGLLWCNSDFAGKPSTPLSLSHTQTKELLDLAKGVSPVIVCRCSHGFGPFIPAIHINTLEFHCCIIPCTDLILCILFFLQSLACPVLPSIISTSLPSQLMFK